ncbi:cAMP-binding domain of CRP or a regulatory subunit of cAMP-dependent protein kinases [Chryseobacterium taichungense]|uniref:cAMP-binding domain of CRP or a regulatory subunit of cAMP-dependent protein kinases n=1 Tax=Chryseobacterium taichungense TaxID=295069 RepID=A0A1H7XLM0_9FLAO|nr:Crp/Fnr family transcriptional regulator [Chryseobacterium taichungense]SEM34680.1 cAMP-binding domain of CRP or a regulatory subunit of cAMP-dependent protein kinases [Chryseobacterium taichungense]
MLIEEELLLSYGAEIEDFKPSYIIFEENSTPKYYYQIIKGRIKLNHYNDEGKELILAILGKGLSVCELLLFIDEKYPVNAIAFEETTVLKLPKSDFVRLLDENQQTSRDINKFLSERLYQKYIMLENNASLRPDVRIKGALNYQKSFSDDGSKFSFEVPLTRQQIASITALRVETVIRTIKKLEKEDFLKIINRKIYI